MDIRLVAVPGDLAAVAALLARVEAADGHRPIGEHKYLMLFQGDPKRVVGLIAELDSKLVGYSPSSQASPGGGAWTRGGPDTFL